jgi:membrane protease YdiL (CAAX protease family)
MTRQITPPGPAARLAGLILFLLLLFAGPSPTAAAPTPAATPPVVVTTISLPPAASWWGRFYSFLENNLTSRARMIQMGVLGMIVALIIMIKK